MIWISAIDNKIYTVIEYRSKKSIEKSFPGKYPELNFTQEPNNTNQEYDFPCVYIHSLPNKEVGQTLDSTSVNGIWHSQQIEVTTNTITQDAMNVIWSVIEQYKLLGYSIIQTPESMDVDSSTKRVVARVRRLIGANDVLIIN